MTDLYSYTKKRNELNRPTNLMDTKVVMKIGCIPDSEADEELPKTEHVLRNPNRVNLSNFPVLSENIVNTERVSTAEKSLFHYEGGWAKDVDITDKNEMKKIIKKKLEKNIDNTDKFTPAVKKVCEVVEAVIAKNNQIDMFENYFEGEPVDSCMDSVKVKTLKLFKIDHDQPKRTVTSISWHPDGSHRLAASYSILRFQQQTSLAAQESYIWDVNNPNAPLESLRATSPVVKLAYNHKNTDQLAFGCYNGQVGVWDVRNAKKLPSILSEIETSHYEPVVDIFWLSSKGGNEFVTCSTDGRVIWWDTRQMSQPTDVLSITETQPTNGVPSRNVGATSMEYVADYGPKYLVGTETGTIMLATKKPKRNVEINFNNSYGLESMGRHMGPVTRIQRNPFNPRFFLSVGDWSVNVR
jgi:dynein intermediate chain 2